MTSYIVVLNGLTSHNHEQTEAADTWVISHNLDKASVIVDTMLLINGSYQTVIPKDVVINDANTVTIYWSKPMIGKARVV